MNRYLIRKLLATLLLGACIPAAWADGTLTHMSGVVSILKADGKVVPGTVGAKAYPGDTVVTGAGGYVRMEMTDGGEMVLRPDSQLKIESYKFVEAKPAEDSVVFSMLKGGLRTVTGLIGKRGNKDAYELKTFTSTMGIRGTQFDLRVCQGNCGALADGTYLAVRFGAVQATNAQGTMPVAAGQVAYVPPQRPPVILPRDPGIGFTPPAVIPKLDEKKKVQASAAASSTPEQSKPAGGAQSTQGTQSQGSKKEGAQDSGKSDSGKSDSGKTDTTTKGESSSNNERGKSAAGSTDNPVKDANQAASGSSAQGGGAAGQQSAPAAGKDCSIQ